ncbi:MAG: hypothetical protein RSC06_13780 [Clostridia bacterium]
MEKKLFLFLGFCFFVLSIAGCSAAPEAQMQDGATIAKSSSDISTKKIVDEGKNDPTQVLSKVEKRYARSLAHNKAILKIDAQVIVPGTTNLEQITLGKKKMDVNTLLSLCLGAESESAVLDTNNPNPYNTTYVIKNPTPPEGTTDRFAYVAISQDGGIDFEDYRRSINGTEVAQQDAPNCKVNREAALMEALDFFDALGIENVEVGVITSLAAADDEAAKGGGYDMYFSPAFNGLPNCRNILTDLDHTLILRIQVTDGGVSVFQATWIPEVVAHETVKAMISYQEASTILEQSLGSTISNYMDTPIDTIVLSTFWNLNRDEQVTLLPVWSFYAGTGLTDQQDQAGRFPVSCHIDAQSGQIFPS